MLIVPTLAVPSQVIQAPLGGQNVTINIIQKTTGVVAVFMDVLVDNVPIISGVLCECLNLIVRSSYLGFIGDFVWIDNQAADPTASADPFYTGFGTQFSLAYLSPADLPALPVGVS